ncbi:unnamed protein product, partial [Linum tenue]
CEQPSEIVEEYVDWFLTRSHPRITHPTDEEPQPRPLLVHQLREQIVDRLGPLLQTRDRSKWEEDGGKLYDMAAGVFELYDQLVGQPPQ